MSEAKHTPGPWRVERTGDRAEITTSDGSPLAEVWGDDDDPQCWPLTANAQLIAASPELLIACQAALDGLYSYRNIDGNCSAMTERHQLRAAIAKAKGLT